MLPMKRLRRADLHLHSNVSYDVPEVAALAPRALFEKAVDPRRGGRRMDYFTLTDHDTMAGWEQLVRQLPEGERAVVIPGVEHTLRDPGIGFTIHVNLFMLNPDQYAEIRRQVVTLDELFEYCLPRGIYMQYNHPTWFELDEWRSGRVEFGKVRRIAADFQVIELNAGRPGRLNAATVSLASNLGKVLTSNSDSHSGDVGLSHNCAPGDCAQEYLANIWAGRGSLTTSDMTYDGMLAVVHEMIDNVLNERGERIVADSVLQHQHRAIALLVRHLVNSRRLRRGPTREVVRLVLKQISRPVVSRWLDREHELARRLAADSALGSHFPMAERAGAA
jgi:predicted metal-dependent phosphoesterase TrpH